TRKGPRAFFWCGMGRTPPRERGSAGICAGKELVDMELELRLSTLAVRGGMGPPPPTYHVVDGNAPPSTQVLGTTLPLARHDRSGAFELNPCKVKPYLSAAQRNGERTTPSMFMRELDEEMRRGRIIVANACVLETLLAKPEIGFIRPEW